MDWHLCTGKRGELQHRRFRMRYRICLNDSGPGMRFGRDYHLGFGASLLRLECRIALEMLLGLFSRLNLFDDLLHFRNNITIRGHKSLFMRFISSYGETFAASRLLVHDALYVARQVITRFGLTPAISVSMITTINTGSKRRPFSPETMGYGTAKSPLARTLS